MKTPEERNEILRIAENYVEGRLDQGEADRLELWLKEDKEARRVFVAYLHDHAALYWRQVSPVKLDGVELEVHEEKSHRQSITVGNLWWPLVGGALLLLVGFLFWSQLTERPIDSVARVFRAEGGSELREGDSFAKGEVVRMEKGQAQFIFKDTGVHVVAMAPFELEFGGEDWLRLVEGRLTLTVPEQGVGFQVRTKDRVIVDLGTKFVVSVSDEGSRVLVFDGEVRVEDEAITESVLLKAGETGLFKKNKKGRVVKRDDLSRGKQSDLPELSPPLGEEGQWPLKGRIFTRPKEWSQEAKGGTGLGGLSREFHDLIGSGFKDQKKVKQLREGGELRFGGIAGHYYGYPLRNGLRPHLTTDGWMAWYQGEVQAPAPGRYRFWGVADNYLFVSVDGKPVLAGGVPRSSLRERFRLKNPNHPEYPYFKMGSLFAGDWFEVGAEGVRLDLLFGDSENLHTVGILMIEKEGERYEESYWGQPKWPLFLTEWPQEGRLGEMKALRGFLEKKMKGSFGLEKEAVWTVLSE